MPRIETLNQPITGSNIKVMICGDPGTGKSVFAASFPVPGFVFDFAGGKLSYRGKDFTCGEFPLSQIGWIEFEKEIINVKKECEEGKWKTVIVDDASSMCDLAMQRALQLDPKRSKSNGPMWNVHYQLVKNLVEGRLRQIIDFPNVNIIFIAHLDISRSAETGAIENISPMLTGQLSIKIPGMFDEVYYASVKRVGQQTFWRMQTVPIGFNKARSRLSGKERLLPDFIDNDYVALMEQVSKAIKQTTKEKPL